MSWIEAHSEDRSIPDEEYFLADPVRQVKAIHFYDYNGTWSLDVSVNETGIIALTDEGIRILHERFGNYEMDENYEICKANGIPETERPLYFYFSIERIISSIL